MRQTPSIDYINISNCVVCGSEIKNSNKNKIYCSDKCKMQGKRTNDSKDFERYVIAQPQTEINMQNVLVVRNQLDIILQAFGELQQLEYALYERKKLKKMYDLVNTNLLDNSDKESIKENEESLQILESEQIEYKNTITHVLNEFQQDTNNAIEVMKNSLKS